MGGVLTVIDVIVTATALVLIGVLMFEPCQRRRAERLERLNRESWAVLQASRRIHDETAEALKEMFDDARLHARISEAREITK